MALGRPSRLARRSATLNARTRDHEQNTECEPEDGRREEAHGTGVVDERAVPACLAHRRPANNARPSTWRVTPSMTPSPPTVGDHQRSFADVTSGRPNSRGPLQSTADVTRPSLKPARDRHARPRVPLLPPLSLSMRPFQPSTEELRQRSVRCGVGCENDDFPCAARPNPAPADERSYLRVRRCESPARCSRSPRNHPSAPFRRDVPARSERGSRPEQSPSSDSRAVGWAARTAEPRPFDPQHIRHYCRDTPSCDPHDSEHIGAARDVCNRSVHCRPGSTAKLLWVEHRNLP